MEPIPAKVPNARITIRAAEWIKGLLSRNMPVSAVAEITGFHWETVKKIGSSRNFGERACSAIEYPLRAASVFSCS